MLVTLETFHFEMSASNNVAPWNMFDMSVTRSTFESKSKSENESKTKSKTKPSKSKNKKNKTKTKRKKYEMITTIITTHGHTVNHTPL